jgi:hypothetical protein
MKKTVFLYFLTTASLFSASISGNVKVYTGENFGVFVYVKGASGYDITDSNGDFKIEGVEKGKEYKVVFQKENFPDIVKNLKINGEDENIVVSFNKSSAIIGEKTVKNNSRKKPRIENKYSEINYKVSKKREIKGKVITDVNEPVFIKIKGKNYGTVINPNTIFTLEAGQESGIIQIYQPGMKKKEFILSLGEKKVDIGDIKLEKEKKDSFDYKISFNKKIDGVVSLYKDDIEKYSIRVENSETAKFKNIEAGNYSFKVVSYGNEDYKSIVKAEEEKAENIVIQNAVSNKRIYVYLYPDNKEMSIKLYKKDELIKSVDSVKGLYIAENIEDGTEYKIVAKLPKHIGQEARAVKAGERVNIVLEREIKGALVSGTIYPFGADAEVMILDGESIIGTGKTDEDGNYEIETEKAKSGRKIIRVRAEGFKEAREIRTVNEGKENGNINIALIPLASDIFGKVKIPNSRDSSGVYVVIEELNIWQLTDGEGKYYFSGVPEGKYTLSFRKYGYKELKKEMIFSKKSIKEVNTEMQPVGRIVINSNIEGFTIEINGIEKKIESRVFVTEEPVGDVFITASKDGYLNENIKSELKEPGEKKELNITFRNSEEYKKYLDSKITKIEELIEGLYVTQAEMKIEEFKSLEGAESYKIEIEKIARRLNQAKGNLFEDDRRILSEIARARKDIELLEKESISYGEKRRKLNEKYRETLDFIEKILNENRYTTYKYELYIFKSEVYDKSGMLNSAKESKLTAMKYMEEEKKKR